MQHRLAAFFLTTLLLVGLLPLASCAVLEPGNVGWFCEADDDCNDGLTCETYRYSGSDHENKLCTGDTLLEDNAQNYGWIILIAGWLFLVLLPIAILILVIIAKIKNRERKPPES
ncbi:hypothetical protein [Enhygromyxa salina]|uniref:Uncharacterized protein n=1 Tax=Enhygromyxa salina TaxID=215803 RepID=A0A2S9XWZ7_9BACT|nr:hypothetical protein [Enhygromyxa salina]PRP97386.1 hypothetical protein ENSA7_67360 [Enhygromyxa salina]